jgi:4-nitrophenyl phosphatase
MGEARPAINRYQSFILDMDGVIYINQEPIPEAVEFIARLREKGKRILFLTNNSKLTRLEYKGKLAGMGINAHLEEIMTSATATANYLKENYRLEEATAFMIGGKGLREELENTPLRLLEGDEARQADYVVVGWDTELTYEKLKIACLALHEGAVFIGTNPDATFPSPDGLWPGAGAILAAVEKSAGREALVVGNPNVYMMQLALEAVGGRAEATLMIGDRLETDILGGWRAGMDTCLVLTGVSRREEVEGFQPKPDMVVESLSELL